MDQTNYLKKIVSLKQKSWTENGSLDFSKPLIYLYFLYNKILIKIRMIKCCLSYKLCDEIMFFFFISNNLYVYMKFKSYINIKL